MENGAEYLQPMFRDVKSFYFEDEITYPDPQEFVALYAATGRYRHIFESPNVEPVVRRQLLPAFKQLVEARVKQEGVLRTPVLMGAFVCTGPISVR
jgi:hypothetical protein